MELVGDKIYAAQLCALHLGGDITWIHNYKYKGEQREKVKSLKNITSISSNSHNNKVNVSAYTSYYRDYNSVNLNYDTEVLWQPSSN